MMSFQCSLVARSVRSRSTPAWMSSSAWRPWLNCMAPIGSPPVSRLTMTGRAVSPAPAIAPSTQWLPVALNALANSATAAASPPDVHQWVTSRSTPVLAGLAGSLGLARSLGLGGSLALVLSLLLLHADAARPTTMAANAIVVRLFISLSPKERERYRPLATKQIFSEPKIAEDLDGSPIQRKPQGCTHGDSTVSTTQGDGAPSRRPQRALAVEPAPRRATYLPIMVAGLGLDLELP